jgi:putative SOS response-associated peptidase YedK
VWFALNGDRPLFAFAGIWTEFKGDRGTKSKPAPGPHLVYGFLTTAPNTVVKPIHSKAMPVILTTDEERDVWMRAMGRSESFAAAVARRRLADRRARRRQGRSGGGLGYYCKDWRVSGRPLGGRLLRCRLLAYCRMPRDQ